jgi:hypothetical protein
MEECRGVVVGLSLVSCWQGWQAYSVVDIVPAATDLPFPGRLSNCHGNISCDV